MLGTECPKVALNALEVDIVLLIQLGLGELPAGLGRVLLFKTRFEGHELAILLKLRVVNQLVCLAIVVFVVLFLDVDCGLFETAEFLGMVQL